MSPLILTFPRVVDLVNNARQKLKLPHQGNRREVVSSYINASQGCVWANNARQGAKLPDQASRDAKLL